MSAFFLPFLTMRNHINLKIFDNALGLLRFVPKFPQNIAGIKIYTYLCRKILLCQPY